jgi:ABC-type uncharacterized transport system ATPase subunit
VIVAAAIQSARAQARSVAARARIEALEVRLDQLRTLLIEARSTSTLSDQEVKDLLGGLEQTLGEAPATIEMPDTPRVTL